MCRRVTGEPDDETIVVAGVTLANETPTGAAVKIRGSMLRNAQVVNTCSIQKRFASGLGFVYAGALASGGQINAARGQFFSGTMDFMVKSEETAVAAVGTGFDAAPTHRVMNTDGNFQGLRLADAPFTAKSLKIRSEKAH